LHDPENGAESHVQKRWVPRSSSKSKENVGLAESSKPVATSGNDGLVETGKETKENDLHAGKVSTEINIGIMSCTVGQTTKSVALASVPETCKLKREPAAIGSCIGHNVGRTGWNGVFRDDRQQAWPFDFGRRPPAG
jgi:hypothetical protein